MAIMNNYTNHGTIAIEAADTGNVPVDIWIEEIAKEDDPNPDGVEIPDNHDWMLKANNYMPRKGRLSGDQCYYVTARNRGIIEWVVMKHILPVYNLAHAAVQGMCMGTHDHLYYWDGSIPEQPAPTAPPENSDG